MRFFKDLFELLRAIVLSTSVPPLSSLPVDEVASNENLPMRPVPPFLFLIAFGFWAGSTACYRFFEVWNEAFAFFGGLLSFVFSLVLLAFCFRVRSQKIFAISLVFLGLVLGSLNGVVGAYALHQQMNAVEGLTEVVSCRLEITEDLRYNDFGSSCRAKTILPNGEGISVRLLLPGETELHFGDIVEAPVSFSLPSENSQQSYWEKGIAASASVKTYVMQERGDFFGLLLHLRHQASMLLDDYEGSGVSLLRAVLFGDRSGLDDGGFYGEIRAVGLAHLVAVSGAHLAIVSASLGLLLRTLRVPRSIIVVLQLAFIGCYLIFTAMPISALRAACMAAVAFFSFYAKRRSSSLNALALCILIIVIISPSSALSLSFLLSSLSTLGIIVLSPLLLSWLKAPLSFMPSFVRESLALTFAASIPIGAVCAATFSQTSLISPLMNLIAAPCFTILCVFGLCAVLLAFLLPFLGDIFLSFIVVFAQGFSEFVSLMSRVPYAAIPVNTEVLPALLFGLVFLGILWFVWPKHSKRAGILTASMSATFLFLLIIVSPYFHDDEVIMLDVGQGDSFVVRSQGKTILIDTGNRDTALLESLGRQGIYKIDALVISHADDDHCGSMDALHGVVSVAQVYLAKQAYDCECKSCVKLIDGAEELVGATNLRQLQVGDRFQVGVFDLEVIWPDEFKDEGGNADSLTLLLSTPRLGEGEINSSSKEEWLMLFCGDAEKEQLGIMLREGRLGDIDILKVGHHGSRNALSDNLVASLRPEIGLVSSGVGNRYGHPTEETLDLLEEGNCQIFRTDQEGDVVCKFDPERIIVRSMS